MTTSKEGNEVQYSTAGLLRGAAGCSCRQCPKTKMSLDHESRILTCASICNRVSSVSNDMNAANLSMA